MTYLQALRYLESFINYEKITAYPYNESLKLERIKGFLGQIGNPQDSLRCIHVAGSKGKGSVCAFLTYILRQAGYKTGLYTSPHLADFRERIRILGHRVTRSPASPAGGPGHKEENDFEGMISRGDLAALTATLKPYIEKYHATSKYGPLSFFEVYTALAFAYFKSKNVDFAVLETGLGGRLDATNTVDALVSVITPISYEHTQKLGNTLKQIAGEKAGIIKGHKVTKSQGHKSIVVCAPQDKEALAVIRNRCRTVGAALYEVGRDIKLEVHGLGFAVQGTIQKYENLRIRLLGEHQLINAATAVGAIEALRSQGISVGTDCLRSGLYNTVWPGRCEVVGNKPFVVLDGAQNAASAQVLRKAVEKNFKYKKAILVLGISDDKDIKGICRYLCPLADEIILTEARNPRAARVEVMEKIIGSQRHPSTSLRAGKITRSQVIKTKNVKEALKKALEAAGKEDLILVAGSLFAVGEARSILAGGLGVFVAAS